jgi:ABC-2 type transport system permease protein
LQSLPLTDYLEVGIFGKIDEEEELYLRKHKIAQIHNKLSFVVDRQPLFAGIDPYNKLIDANARDNRMRITVVDFGNR